MNATMSPLFAEGPASDDPALMMYGRFVGEWAVRNRDRPAPDAPWRESTRRWVFAWVLGGRGVQDILVPDAGEEPVASGTTVRVYDPAIGAWRVEWFGTLHGDYVSLLGRPLGADGIRQEGVARVADGDVPIRWDFSAITEHSFAWDGWSSPDGGASWWHEQHMDCTRVA